MNCLLRVRMDKKVSALINASEVLSGYGKSLFLQIAQQSSQDEENIVQILQEEEAVYQNIAHQKNQEVQTFFSTFTHEVLPRILRTIEKSSQKQENPENILLNLS